MPLTVRRVVVKVGAAVSRPHVLGHRNAIQVVPADPRSGSGDTGHDVSRATAVVVQPFADDVLLFAPDDVGENRHHGNHVGEGVGGGFVVELVLVLVWVQGAALVMYGVGVIVQDRLGVLKVHVYVFPWEGLHLIRFGKC